MIIGAQKAGTSSIYHWLRGHPHVVAHEKEVSYFSQHYGRGPDWYRSHFPLLWTCRQFLAKHGRPLITGEATPEYMLDPHTPGRMAQLIPDVKLIVSLRNPVDRAYSQFQMNRRVGIEPVESFTQALSLEDGRFGDPTALSRTTRENLTLRKWTHYLGRGHYADALLRWFAEFPREQFCIVAFDDLVRSPAQTVATLESFLGLAPHLHDSLAPHNDGSYPPLEGETRAALADYFRPHNERLYELLGRDFGWDEAPAGPATARA